MRTIWLASYPKSGNTWFRMLIANLSAHQGKPVDINELADYGGIASARRTFDYYLLIESGLLTHAEVDCLRPRLYEELSRAAAVDHAAEAGTAVRFVKVHDAYTLAPNGQPLLAGALGAAGAIVIVRDPRDIAPSLANHNRRTIDAAIDQLNKADTQYCANVNQQHYQLRHRLLDWSSHVASWLDQKDIPVHLVRYEDLKADTAGVLDRALAFAGWPAGAEEVQRAVKFADFSELKAQEQERGFSELPEPHLPGTFFRRGEAGAWRLELSTAQIERIESAHAAVMGRLGYRLSSVEERAPG